MSNRAILKYHIDCARHGLCGRPIDHKICIAKYWKTRELIKRYNFTINS